jgi:hypothetical protein
MQHLVPVFHGRDDLVWILCPPEGARGGVHLWPEAVKRGVARRPGKTRSVGAGGQSAWRKAP